MYDQFNEHKNVISIQLVCKIWYKHMKYYQQKKLFLAFERGLSGLEEPTK